MPLKYVRFLNYATECVLLRRVGDSSYIFMHGLLMEYFATLEEHGSSRSMIDTGPELQ